MRTSLTRTQPCTPLRPLTGCATSLVTASLSPVVEEAVGREMSSAKLLVARDLHTTRPKVQSTLLDCSVDARDGDASFESRLSALKEAMAARPDWRAGWCETEWLRHGVEWRLPSVTVDSAPLARPACLGCLRGAYSPQSAAQAALKPLVATWPACARPSR